MIAGKRTRTLKDTEAEARILDDTIKLAVLKGEPITLDAGGKVVAGCTMRRLVEVVAESRWKGLKSETDLHRNGENVAEIVGHERSVSTVTQADVDRTVTALVKLGNGPATINRKLSALNTMFRYARERGWMDKELVMPWKKEPQGRLRVITSQEEQDIVLFFAGVEDYEMAALVPWLIETGMRLSEALRVTGTDIQDGMVVIEETKNGKRRAVPLTTKARGCLPSRPKFDRAFDMTVDAVENRWKKMRTALDKDSDPEFVIHALRHTCASRLVARGVPIYDVCAWLGHSSVKVTERYAHLDPGRLKAVANMMNASAADGNPLHRTAVTAPTVVGRQRPVSSVAL